MRSLLADLKKSKIDAKKKFLVQRELNKQQNKEKESLACGSSDSSESSGNLPLQINGCVPHLDVFLNREFWDKYGVDIACEVVVIVSADGNHLVTQNGILLVNSLPCWWNLLKCDGVADPDTLFAKYLRLMGVFFIGAGFATLQALNVYYADFDYDINNYSYLIDDSVHDVYDYLISEGIETKFAKFIVIAISFSLIELDVQQCGSVLDAVKDAFKKPLWIYQPKQFERYLDKMAVISEFKKSIYEDEYPQLGQSACLPIHVNYTKEMKEGLIESEFKQILIRDKGGKFVFNNYGVEYKEHDKVSSYVYGQMNKFTLGDVIYSQWKNTGEELVIAPVLSGNIYAIKTLKDGSLVYGWTPMLRAFLEMVLDGTIKIEVDYLEIDGNKTFKIDHDFMMKYGDYILKFDVMRRLLILANKYYAGIILHKFSCVIVYRIKHFNNVKLRFKKYQLSDDLVFFVKNGVMVITDLAFSAVAHRGVCSILKARPVTATVVSEKDVLREFTRNMLAINDGLRSREGEIDVEIDQRFVKHSLYLSDIDEGKGILSHGLLHMLKAIVYESNIGRNLVEEDDIRSRTVIGERYSFYGNRDMNGYWYEFVVLDASLNMKRSETSILKDNLTYIHSFILVHEYDKVIGTILNTADEQDGDFYPKTIFTGGCIALISNSILSNVTMTTTGCHYMENPKIVNLGYTNGDELSLLFKSDYERFIKRINFLLSHFVSLGCSSYQQHFMHHGIHLVRERLFQTRTFAKIRLEETLCPSTFQILCEKTPNSRSNAIKISKDSDPLHLMYNEYVADFSHKCDLILSLSGAKNLFKIYANSPFGYRCPKCFVKYSIDAWEISQNCCMREGHVIHKNGFTHY